MSDDPRDGRKLPEGRLGRLGRLAAVGLRTGAGMVLRHGDGAGAARHAADVLGQLRGLAAKLGQMAGYVDGIIPDEHRAAYEAAMATLQAAAPRSDPAAVRRLVEAELRAPLDRLFSSWIDEPIASASIGQVHRATLSDELGGAAVAVKVQHPGIVRALESDLANAGFIESMLGPLGARKVNSAQLLEAVRARFREELDYALEARRMEFFRALSAGDPEVHLPRVYAARSSGRVLTTELVEGARFVDAVAAAPGERAAWARTMWRFVFRGNLVGGHFNADPHPGNFFFHDGGRVTFLDFGCVNPIGPQQLALARAIHHAAIRGDESGFREATRRLLPTRPGRLERPAVDYVRLCFEPLFSSPYRLTRPYASRLVDEMKALGLLSLKTPEGEMFQMPADMIFMNRLQFGFYSVLARFDVEVDYAAIERGFWPDVEEAIAGTRADARGGGTAAGTA